MSSSAGHPDADEENWLDAEEQATWQALAGLMIRLPTALDRQLQRDSGISHFEYLVMATLSATPDRTQRMSTLAELAQAQLPRLSQVVGRLEKRGWVTRRPDPTNRRYTLACLTDSGWAALRAAAPGHVRAVRSLVLDPLTDNQVRELGEIGRRILAATGPSSWCPQTRPDSCPENGITPEG